MALSEAFMADLISGRLKNLCQFLYSDHSICPEIREDRLTLYYRGGAIATVEQKGKSYSLQLNDEYLNACTSSWLLKTVEQVKGRCNELSSEADVDDLIGIIPAFKACMDAYFHKKGGMERELQQQIVRENNRAGDEARSTDYYVCDIETADAINGSRFDLVGVHWPSTPADRRVNTGRRLFIAEVKYGTGAIGGTSGLTAHLVSLRAYATNNQLLDQLKNRMLTSFNQKHQLGFMECTLPLASFCSDGFDWIIVLINLDPASQRLNNELNSLRELAAHDDFKSIKIRVATSHHMGFGLWDPAIYDLNEFSKFEKSLD